MIRLWALLAIVLLSAGEAAAKTPAAPGSLTCRSDGKTPQVTIVYLPLPPGFRAVSGTMTRPRKGNGNYGLRVMLVDGKNPPEHATGLVSTAFPPMLGTAPMIGYGFSLKETAVASQAHENPKKWLVVSDSFRLRIRLTSDSKVAARLTWDMDGAPRDFEYDVESYRSDYRRLGFVCWNGDFELSGIRFETD